MARGLRILYVQKITKNYHANMPGQFDYGWVEIQKSATLSVDYLVDVLSAKLRRV